MKTQAQILDQSRLWPVLALLALLFAPLTACSTDPPTGKSATADGQGQEILTYWQSIRGGRLALETDLTGTPKPASLKAYVNFKFPTAVAARGPDLYVADTGARQLYRYDAMFQALIMMPLSPSEITVTPETRLQVGSDQSLFVLNPARSEITRFSRGGQQLQKPYAPLPVAHLSDFVMDDTLGQMVLLDRLNQRLVTMHPHGLAGHTIAISGLGGISSLGALSGSGRMLAAVDPSCACVVVLDEEGRVQERLGEGMLAQPRLLAVDRYGRIYVADIFDRTLKVFVNGVLAASYNAGKLMVTEITALAVDQNALYIADGPGAQVAAFRIRPPEGMR